MPPTSTEEKKVWQLLEEVFDPEIPVLSIVDMGVLREVEQNGAEVVVKITPTYSGCPAMRVIEEDIVKKLNESGIKQVKIETILSPPWTTDWLTEHGKKKLKEYGIAPPEEKSADKGWLTGQPKQVECPRCNSKNTEMVSQFGSTACKALWKCLDCKEPFDYFKCL